MPESSGSRIFGWAVRPFARLARLIGVVPRLLIFVTLCAAVAPGLSPSASAAAPPLPVVVTPDPVQARLQAQVAVERAQAQARLAADQARVQARLDANQARLQGQLAAQQAGTQAQLEIGRQGAATAAQLAALPLPISDTMQEPWARQIGRASCRGRV